MKEPLLIKPGKEIIAELDQCCSKEKNLTDAWENKEKNQICLAHSCDICGNLAFSLENSHNQKLKENKNLTTTITDSDDLTQKSDAQEIATFAEKAKAAVVTVEKERDEYRRLYVAANGEVL
ncbi:10308_t:CDS:2, partial [Racocetra fulgida]